MQDLPHDLRVIAIDLRGYRRHASTRPSTRPAVCATSATTCTRRSRRSASRRRTSSAGRWAAGVIMQYALDHPVLSLTLESPISPYGFGGTRRDGSRLTDDDAGCGGGVANPDFVQRLIDHDESDEAPTSPRSVFRVGLRRPGLHDRARGRLGRVDAVDLDGDRQLPGRFGADARTGRAWRPARSACSTPWRRSTSTCRGSST